MSVQLIQKRLENYNSATKEGELNAIKEIVQEIALCALSRTDFFKQAAFMGGTCLRIVHDLPRFSEDLDFALVSPDTSFQWEPILHRLALEFETYDLHLETKERSQADQAVKKAFLKEDSFGKVLELTHQRQRSDPQKILVKLEIDTNPPAGAQYESKMVRFPFPYSIQAHDLDSLCAGKCLAMLCRQYIKGRDWFDFLWYISQGINPNLDLLTSGLNQNGPWQGQEITATTTWLQQALHSKIDTIDFDEAQREVLPFVSGAHRQSLGSWNRDYFHSSVDLFLQSKELGK